jgi:hypothetical protein
MMERFQSCFQFNLRRYTKVVVDELRVKTLLPQRQVPGQTDRYQGLLHSAPVKLGRGLHSSNYQLNLSRF